MTIDLSAPERELLLAVLRDQLGSLKGEIYKTETWDYKQELKGREELLVGLIGRLESAEAQSVTPGSPESA